MLWLNIGWICVWSTCYMIHPSPPAAYGVILPRSFIIEGQHPLHVYCIFMIGTVQQKLHTIHGSTILQYNLCPFHCMYSTYRNIFCIYCTGYEKVMCLNRASYTYMPYISPRQQSCTLYVQVKKKVHVLYKYPKHIVYPLLKILRRIQNMSYILGYILWNLAVPVNSTL